MTRALAYIRQRPIVTRADLLSKRINLERQKDELRSYVAWFHLTICDTIVDEFNPNADILSRAGLQLALHQMVQLEARALLVNCLSDLTTSSADLQFLLDRYFGKGFVLFSESDRIRSDTQDGWKYLETKAKQLELA